MMSYTMECTALWSSASMLMRRTSPWTRIIGGRPAERCKSDALFLTPNASNWVMSTESLHRCGWLCWLSGLVRSGLTIMTTIATNLQQVADRMTRACMAAGRAPASARPLAAAQTFHGDAVAQAVAAGQRAFGENYIQEGVDKILALRAALPDAALQWHCIGPVQSNKTRLVAEHFDWVDRVPRPKKPQPPSPHPPPPPPP